VVLTVHQKVKLEKGAACAQDLRAVGARQERVSHDESDSNAPTNAAVIIDSTASNSQRCHPKTPTAFQGKGKLAART